MKKVLLINGHPSKTSYCSALLDAYKTGVAHLNTECKCLIIYELYFDINLAEGYKNREGMILEPDIVRSHELINWADHIVMAYPTWWGSMPALTKGFIDRVFLPGFAFKHHEGKLFPEKLLKGKSIRLLVTMDTPKLWFYIVFRAAQYRMLRNVLFEYVGFHPVRFSTFGGMRKSSEGQRRLWLNKVGKLGKQLK
jgi:putative NADPH-quinone reductase